MRNPRVAGAPISWGVCEAPGWGLQLDADDVLAELRSAGYVATEAGPDDFIAASGGVLASRLATAELDLAGAFIPVSLHDAAARERSVVSFDAAIDRIERFPDAVACLAVLGARADYEAREVLDDDGWKRTLAGLDELAARAAARGVTCVVHPHVGTVVERSEDVDRVLDGSAIGLCLDTGHLMLGGVDPLELARRVAGRIAHVHLKDVDHLRAERWRAGRSPSYHASVADGMYVALGTGDACVADVIDALAGSGYDGWYVLERDAVLDPSGGRDRDARVGSAERDRTWVEGRIAATGSTTDATSGARR